MDDSSICIILIAGSIRERVLLWIQAGGQRRLLKSTPQPPCSACRYRDDVDAARLQSVGYTGGADISSQIIICLFCMRIICDILSFKYVIPVTLENIELTAYLC